MEEMFISIFDLPWDPEKRKEQRDFNLIQPDKSAQSNLPTKPVYGKFGSNSRCSCPDME